MRKFIGAFLFVLLALFMSQVPVIGHDHGVSGEITVYNESGFDVTIRIADRDRGKLEAGYSKTYRVRLGEVRVEAETDSKYDKSCHKDFVLSKNYPYDSCYIYNSDLN